MSDEARTAGCGSVASDAWSTGTRSWNVRAHANSDSELDGTSSHPFTESTVVMPQTIAAPFHRPAAAGRIRSLFSRHGMDSGLCAE